ncbi:hypothetical protein [Demequina sp.]|uniref:hypothetical protein n=1 Tax=Demequina sp. TaxID=2050685 RepID=UPI003A89E6B1
MRLTPACPVIVRGLTSVQVGLHAPVILERLTAEQMRFLATLEGGRNLGASEQRRHRALLESLADAGQTARPSAPAAVVRFRSGTAIAVEAATMLARLGWAIAFADGGRAWQGPRENTVLAPGSSHGSAAAARVRATVPGADVRGADATAALDVLVTVGIPVTAARLLLSDDQPHLLVTVDEGGVTVGPLVIPGATACVTCLGLAATERDRLWPAVALQCEGRTPHTTPMLAGLAGMLTARACTHLSAGTDPGVWRVSDEGVRQLPSPEPHPACACLQT